MSSNKENKIAKEITNGLFELFTLFYYGQTVHISIECLEFYNDYHPENGDEVVTYKYKFHVIIEDKLYIYDGWCYKEDLPSIAMGIFSHWLLKNYEIYNGASTAWYNMYTCIGNLVKKENE